MGVSWLDLHQAYTSHSQHRLAEVLLRVQINVKGKSIGFLS